MWNHSNHSKVESPFLFPGWTLEFWRYHFVFWQKYFVSIDLYYASGVRSHTFGTTIISCLKNMNQHWYFCNFADKSNGVKMIFAKWALLINDYNSSFFFSFFVNLASQLIQKLFWRINSTFSIFFLPVPLYFCICIYF